ncbi:formimidoylglutamate deiminase [Bradymonas sediminis]|uniref:Formimidoylglutamate deiminase n=1 Tax=Bradymonas sediminis TaxID=1548548 RepID=A0A2Z4FNW3_9DELT|nr:formimidoylglutamate deiminase [Bradymonas sediminis]AWV90398.1 formimidoylglutamate deiminase [Bradymonas sediminis]TDP72216.1 formimidoylglutamate deiminase [Bradymonas sediminis]
MAPRIIQNTCPGWRHEAPKTHAPDDATKHPKHTHHSPMKTLYAARYLLDDSQPTAAWIENGHLAVDDAKILGVFGPEAPQQPEFNDFTRVDLGNVAVVPGLVNAHSHAFQRGIRGKTEYLVPGREAEDFWTWRQAMYAAALGYEADKVQQVSKLAFMEMALSGISTVGEFHYLHHQPDGQPYADPNELANRVIAAAKEVGIRIALLRVGYNRAGFGRAAEDEQRRFVEDDVDTYLARLGDLRTRWQDDPLVTVGLAPHSIRAVPENWLRAMGEYAAAEDLALHIHACEQRREIDESLAEYGRAPIAALAEMGLLSERLSIVHGTHLADAEYDLLADARPSIVACPTTERNLGDGFLPAKKLVERGVPICLGSDSHTNIDLWEEMRLVEYHERLRYEKRNVLASAKTPRTADVLWPMGAQNGARALRIPAGTFAPGNHADFVAVDLEHITLLGSDADSLLPNMILSMTPGAVRDVFVGGEKIVEGGRLTRLPSRGKTI